MKINGNIMAITITAFALLSAFWHQDGLSDETRWWLYDLSNAIQIAAVSFMLFWFMPVRLAVVKSVGLFWLLDSAKEVFDIAVNDNQNDWKGLIVQHSIFFLACLITYGRYSLQDAVHSQHSAPKESGVYIVVSRYFKMRNFLYWLFGFSSGRITLAFINMEENYADLYYYDPRTWKYSRRITNIDTIRDSAFIELKANPARFREILSEQLGTYWTPTRNCGSVLIPALQDAGYRMRFGSVFPSVLIKSVLKQNHYARSSASPTKT